MQSLIIVYDYENSLEKRMECRAEHLVGTKKLISEGKIINAGALLEDDKMIGSTLLVDFTSDEELDKWLASEPYVLGKVWDMETIQIVDVKLLPKD